MSAIKHAKRELAFLLKPDEGETQPDSMNKMMYDNLLEMVNTFAEQGHSGFSAGYAIEILILLLKQEPIRPLTGEDDEWDDVTDMNDGDVLYQNNRCSRVFKDESGVYDTQGKAFNDPGGCSYSNSNSRVPVVFPYTPTTVYVDVDENGKEIQ